jgi:hypothetical protein
MYASTEEFCVVNLVTGLHRPNTGKNDDDDHDHVMKVLIITPEKCNFKTLIPT